MINKLSYNNYRRPILENPSNEKKILLHSCCAPCACEVIEAILASQFELTVLFYNPNIHPRAEYEIRKDENKRYCDTKNIPCVDLDYDKNNWFQKIKGYENEPERGHRCTLCFDMRFERTASYAYQNEFPIITSSLGISRWKNMEQINACGINAAKKFSGVTYWTLNWRKQGGSMRMIEISKAENFYQQEYCGCIYSLRDTNLWHKKNHRPKIQRGIKFYTYKEIQEKDS